MVAFFNQIVSLDVAEGGLGVSVCNNNQLKIWETDTGIVRVCNLFLSILVMKILKYILYDFCRELWRVMQLTLTLADSFLPV